MSFALSFDLDWAADFILDDLREILASAGHPATFFCTHSSPAVERLCQLRGAETALHPNFLGAESEETTLKSSCSLFPRAQGLRNHCLYYHSRLLKLFHSHKIQYFSNDLMFLRRGLAPYYDWSGLVRLPIYWEDDVHCVYFREDFSLDLLKLSQPGVKIFNFHPVHVWLNTKTLEDYQKAKPDLGDRERAEAHRHKGQGIRALLQELLQYLGDQRPTTLIELASSFRAENVFAGRTDWLERI